MSLQLDHSPLVQRDRARFNELVTGARADLYTLPDDLTEIVHGPDK